MENLQIRGLEIPVVLQRANRKTMEVTLQQFHYRQIRKDVI